MGPKLGLDMVLNTEVTVSAKNQTPVVKSLAGTGHLSNPVHKLDKLKWEHLIR